MGAGEGWGYLRVKWVMGLLEKEEGAGKGTGKARNKRSTEEYKGCGRIKVVHKRAKTSSVKNICKYMFLRLSI